MSAFTIASANAYLKLVLTNVDFANVGDAGGIQGSATAGSLYAALYTADPGPSGTATTNEVSASGYARIEITREAASWTITNNTASPAADIEFAELSGGTGTAPYWGITSTASGAGILLLRGQLSPAAIIGALQIPRITTASTLTIATS